MAAAEHCFSLRPSRFDRVTYPVLGLYSEKFSYIFQKFIGETEELWEKLCAKDFRGARREELETYRELYLVSKLTTGAECGFATFACTMDTLTLTLTCRESLMKEKTS